MACHIIIDHRIYCNIKRITQTNLLMNKIHFITINTTQWAEDDFIIATDLPMELVHDRVSTFVKMYRETKQRWNKDDIIQFIKDSYFEGQYFITCVMDDTQYISV